jgi:signal peptidase I
MRTKVRRRASGVAVLAVLALGWVFFAPAQLGGSTLYTATVGDSMEPRFHKGDLALVRPASDYRVGDIVLYQSPVLQRPVLHRILVIQQGRYYFQGDNNDFVDPGYVTRSALVGKLWHRVPHAGNALDWFGAPSHAALLAGAAAAFLLLGGGADTRRRRRRRPSGRHEDAVVKPVGRLRFHRPRKTVENIVGAVALVVAAVLLVVGFTTPLSRPSKVTGYIQSGVFSYQAKVDHPVTAYPTGMARTGDPLLLNDFRLVKVRFAYRFRSGLAHAVKGTVALKAVILADSGLRNTYTLEKATPFVGDLATVSGTFDVQKLRTLITELSIDSRAAGSYSIELSPVIRVHGVVGGENISDTFAPTLPFTVDQAILKLNVASPTTVPGATYAPPSPSATLADGLKPSQAGTIPGIEPNYQSFARYHFAVSVVRGAGLGFAGLALIALLAKLFKPERERWSHERRIAFRYECVVVDVVSFRADESPSRPATDVPDFESLAILARYCERPILREIRDGRSAYAVEDDGRLYVHRTKAQPLPTQVVPAATLSATPVSTAGRSAPRTLRRVARPVGLLVILGVAATLVTTFTATTTVPLSSAGTSDQARQLSQLTPSQCAAIAATTLVIGTTATTSGTPGNDLVLGWPGVGTLNIGGSGGNDCLIGGGGAGTSNKFNGGSGADVCIGAPGATNTFAGCETQYN